MGNAFTGLADDEYSLYYNPAGLSNMTSDAVSLNHTAWFEDIRIDNITFGYNLLKSFGIGAGITYMWMPRLEGMDNNGQPTGKLDVSSSVANLGLSYKVNSYLNIGLGIKYFQDKLATYAASGTSFDLGILVKNIVPGFSTGLSVQNLGDKVSYDREKQNIPLTIRGGISYKIYSPNILLSLDVSKSIDTDFALLFGVEYLIADNFSLRMGNRFTQIELFTPSFGIGFHFNQQYHLFYTFSNYADLGGTHRIGFSYRFGTVGKVRLSQLSYGSSQIVNNIPPENLEVKIDNEELVLSWNRVTGVQYNAYAKHSSTNKWIKLNKTPLYNNTLTYKKPVTPGNYFFRVCSLYKDKESSFSKEVFIYVK